MAGALGLVLTGNTVPMEGSHAIPVYVDDSLPIVGPSRACVVTTGEVPQMGGPPLAVRLAPAGTPAIGPALPVYVVPGGGSLSGVDPTLIYTNKVKALNPIAYWPMAESSGSVALDESGNGRNGAYTAVTLGQAGIGDGRTSASFNGTTSFNNIYSASLAGAFNKDEGTIAVWAQVSGAGVWTDAANRDLFVLQADGTNNLFLRKSSTSNTIRGSWQGGGTSATVQTGSFSPVGWFHIAMAWSKAANEMKFYLNGAQSGATQTMTGTWTGALAAGACDVGSGGGAVRVFSGTMAHAAVWVSPLSAAQIASLATV